MTKCTQRLTWTFGIVTMMLLACRHCELFRGWPSPLWACHPYQQQYVAHITKAMLHVQKAGASLIDSASCRGVEGCKVCGLTRHFGTKGRTEGLPAGKRGGIFLSICSREGVQPRITQGQVAPCWFCAWLSAYRAYP